MSEPVTRQRPAIDLDEFERHLDASHSGHHDDDPLAELARLVGEHRDPYENMFAQEAAARAPQFEHHASQRPSVDFAAIEAGLRGTLPGRAEPAFDAHGYDQQGQDAYAGHDGYAAEQQFGHDGYGYAADRGHETRAPRVARRPVYLMAATIAIGVVGVGAAFALKSHGTNPSDVRTIQAAAGPTKIQPPAQDQGDAGPQDNAILGKSNQAQPVKVVSNSEEPVDVSAAVQNNAANNATDANNPSNATDAASVPIPPAPGDASANAQAPAPMSGADFGMGMPAPKKVKVVSVRPDGTILSNDPPAPAPTSAPPSDTTASIEPAPPPPVADVPAPVAKASTPKPANTPKTSSRVTPKHNASAATTDVAAPADAAPTDEAPAPKSARKAKAQKLAMAEPTDTAPAADDAPKGTGGFAVQLAAPGSEAEARAASSKLAHKFAKSLVGHHLGFHRAQSNGRTVFRVRADGLTKDEAQGLCEKLKSDGGSCFVAKS